MTTLTRSPVTLAVLEAVRTVGKPVGDGMLPQANWIGQPMAAGAQFEPFAVVSENLANHSWGPLSEPQADWQLPYLIESFGITRAQCSWMADAARKALAAINRDLVIDSVAHHISWLSVDSVGAPTRMDTFQPPFFHAQDLITVWIAKETGP